MIFLWLCIKNIFNFCSYTNRVKSTFRGLLEHRAYVEQRGKDQFTIFTIILLTNCNVSSNRKDDIQMRKVLVIVLGIRGKKKRSYGSPLFVIFRICNGKNCIQFRNKHLVQCNCRK